MKKKISEKDLEEIQKEEKALQKMQLQDSDFKANSNSFLKRMIIPKDADFRLNSIKFEFSQILVTFIISLCLFRFFSHKLDGYH